MRSPIYRLYVDETGNADLAASQDPNHRYLSLTGVIVRLDHITGFVRPRLDALKQEVFAPDPDQPIILHRKDIVNRKGPFRILQDIKNQTLFDARLMSWIVESRYTVITAVIDKLEHLNRYSVWRHDPYHYCMEVLAERYVLFLRGVNSCGDVMGEVRGGKFDRRLESAFGRLYQHGNGHIPAARFQEHLTSKRLKLKPKHENIAGLQLADILAHPSALNMRAQRVHDVQPTGFGAHVVQVLEDLKYRRNPYTGVVYGWGTKWLP